MFLPIGHVKSLNIITITKKAKLGQLVKLSLNYIRIFKITTLVCFDLSQLVDSVTEV